MKIPLTVKQLLWLIAAIIGAAFLLSGLTLALIAFARTGSDWASALIQALGNVAGGIIGGIVAIIVAAYQINRTLLGDHEKQARTSTTMLKLIREELRDNVSTLESAVPFSPNYLPLLKTQLSDETWKSTMVYLSVSDNLLVMLNVAYRKINICRHLEENEITDDFLRDLTSTLSDVLEDVGTEVNAFENSEN